MSAPAITPKKRYPSLRTVLHVEQLLVLVGLVVYAILVSLDQHPPLWVVMFAILTVGNLLIPLASPSAVCTCATRSLETGLYFFRCSLGLASFAPSGRWFSGDG